MRNFCTPKCWFQRIFAQFTGHINGKILFLLMMRFIVWLCVAVVVCCSCEWDPPHDNILDPDSPNYRPPPIIVIGSLEVAVRTMSDLPQGEWQAIAYRDTRSDTVYAHDTITVEIQPAKLTRATFHLDALPSFVGTKVNAITQYEQDDRTIYAHLTARVADPDGIADLARVEWMLVDPDQGILMRDTLDFYNPDSAYWWVDVPSADFPGGNITNALTLPFRFVAVDDAGNSSQSSALLARVLYRVAGLLNDQKEPPNPTLRWNYSYGQEFTSPEEFYFSLHIYDGESIVYKRQIIPDVAGYWVHTVEDTLEIGRSYEWDVWVVDLHNDQVRSVSEMFQVVSQ
jgi:hypothetical protein